MSLCLRRYAKTAAMSATSYVGDSPLFLLDYLLRVLRVAVLLSVWRTLFRHGEPASGLTLPAVLTYTVIAEVFADQLQASTDVAWSFWSGSIATRFIKPMGVFGQYIAEAGGKWTFSFVTFSLPLLLLAAAMGINPFPASAFAGVLFLVSLLLAIAVGLALDFLFTAVAIGMQFPPFALERLRTAIATLLSGAFIPLALLPWNIGSVFGWLPFASMASAPLRIYTGTGDAAWLLAVQAFWAIMLWPLTIQLWRINKEKMVAYGG